MPGFGIPLNAVVTRRSPVVIPRRDFTMAASDTPTLTATIWQSEGDTAPLDITGATFALNLFHDPDQHRECWWDYGFFGDRAVRLLQQITGTVIDTDAGRVDFAIAPVLWIQRLVRVRYALVMSYPAVASTGIGVAPDPNAPLVPPPYTLGNLTLLYGVLTFLRTPFVPLTQQLPILGGIGVGP